MRAPSIKTIKKIRVAGKYIEFWFEEDQKILKNIEPTNERERFLINESFDGSYKMYDFIELLEIANLYGQILNTGLIGLKTLWKRSEYNTHYEFVDFLENTRLVLIEKV